jgi:ribonuclease HI
VVKQLNGQYKVKNEALKPLYRKATSLLDALPDVKVMHVPRAENKEADKLANAALDGKDLDGE